MVPTTYKKGSLDRKIGQGSPFYIDSSCFPAYSFHRNITICALVHLLPTPNRSLPIPSAMLSCAAPCHSGCVVGIRCDITEPGTATCSGAAHRKVKSSLDTTASVAQTLATQKNPTEKFSLGSFIFCTEGTTIKADGLSVLSGRHPRHGVSRATDRIIEAGIIDTGQLPAINLSALIILLYQLSRPAPWLRQWRG